MKDGRDIYIGPEDTLTDVRRHLEQVPTLVRNVTLIFDRHTLLRNPTDWRNLHAHARNQGKDVLIISSDPQTRAMARAAKFRVVDSSESSAASHAGANAANTHPARRPTNKSKAAAPPQRILHRNPATNRQDEMHAEQPPTTNAAYRSSPTPEKRPSQPLFNDYKAHKDEIMADKLRESVSYRSSMRDDDTAYKQPYDFRVEEEARIRPLSQQELEEEPDMLVEDYNLTENLRQAAREAAEAAVQEPRNSRHSNSKPLVEPISQSQEFIDLSLTPDSDDPFSFLDDRPTPSKAEQRAAVFVDNMDTSEHAIQDISELPTEVLDTDEFREDADDLSDRDEIIEVDPPARSWQASFLTNDALDEMSRVHGVVPRSSRSGHIMPRSSRELLEREREPQPSLEERSSRISKSLNMASEVAQQQPASAVVPPSSTKRPTTGRMGAGGQSGQIAPQPMQLAPASQKLPPAQRQPALSKPAPKGKQSQQRKQSKTTGRGRATIVGTRSRQARSGRATRKGPQETRSAVILIAIAILILLLVGLLGFIVPSASVTITLSARNFSASNLKLLATTDHTPSQTGVVTAVQLTQTFPTSGSALTGTGTATGTTPIGTAPAKGTVTITNNGNTFMIIPSGTVVQTVSGIQFMTTAQAPLNIAGSIPGNTVPVPVTAQQLGEAGNVPAGSITVIPASSLSMIARANNIDATKINISVTNPDKTSGGGAGTATVVTQLDINKEANVLRMQLQRIVNSWIKQQVHDGDVAGTPVVTEKIVDAPPVNQTEASGSFKMGLFLDVKQLVVRSTALQRAAQSLLNNKLQSSSIYKGNYEVVTSAKYPVQFSQMKTTENTGNTRNSNISLTLTFNAAGKIVPKLSVNQVRELIGTKTKSDAQTILSNMQDVQSVSIHTWPTFLSWLPWGQRIQVIYVPGTPPATKPGPAGATPTPHATTTPTTK